MSDCDQCELKGDGEYTQLVRAFAERMLRELHANQSKGCFLDWSPSFGEWEGEVEHHYEKLKSAIHAGDAERVFEYSADLANFCMKASQMFWREIEELEKK